MKDYFNDRQYVGQFSESDLREGEVYTAKQGSEAQGVVVELQVRVVDNVICDVRYRVYGNRYLIAVMAYVAHWLMDRSLKEASLLTSEEIIKALSLPTIQTFCAVLAREVIENLSTPKP